jgi:hypothetical protein
MRIALLVAVAIAGCGGDDDYANEPRPPAPINVTAAISDERISVSPRSFGAGPIVLIVSNQTDEQQEAMFETDELGGEEPGLAPQSTGSIRPGGTATLKVDVREGTYSLRTDGGPGAVTIDVGQPRPSAQNELLQP